MIIQTRASLSLPRRDKSKRQRKRSATGKDRPSLDLNTFFKYILLPSGTSPLEYRVLPHLEGGRCARVFTRANSLGCSLTQKEKTWSSTYLRQKSFGCSITQEFNMFE